MYFGSTEFAVESLKELHSHMSLKEGQTYPLIGKLEVVVPPVKMKRVGKVFGEVCYSCYLSPFTFVTYCYVVD